MGAKAGLPLAFRWVVSKPGLGGVLPPSPDPNRTRLVLDPLVLRPSEPTGRRAFRERRRELVGSGEAYAASSRECRRFAGSCCTRATLTRTGGAVAEFEALALPACLAGKECGNPSSAAGEPAGEDRTGAGPRVTLIETTGESSGEVPCTVA